jgi:hypothetical protein
MKTFLAISFFLILFVGVEGQTPQAFNYQAIARDTAGVPLAGAFITVRIGIISVSATGVLEWEEVHSLSTNTFGWFNLLIGQGVSTGSGAKSSFSLINWGTSNYYCKIEVDDGDGSGFRLMGTQQYFSVPYALFANQANTLTTPISLDDLSDADTAGVINGKVLKWNGINWVPSNDIVADSIAFALNGLYSIYADTALYAINTPVVCDTSNFAFSSDSSMYSNTSGYSTNSNSSVYSDTALYSLNCISTSGNWNLSGNLGTNPIVNFIGTSDVSDLVLKTNNLERMRIMSNGRIGIGTSAPLGSLHIIGNDGFIDEGTFGSGATLSLSGAGTRMVWYPKKASFRAGTVIGNAWDDVNIGDYSFAIGYDTRAIGKYSFSGGQTSSATKDNAMAFGFNSIASGYASIAIGSQATASGYCSIALGRGAVANDTGGVSLSYHGGAGRYAVAFGYYTNASGKNSVAMGTSSSTNGHKGSFIFADITKQTTTPSTLSTADNQFMAKASGGFVFYTDINTTMGVTLPAGGGSWATISDRNKKNNFKKVNTQDVLEKLSGLEITTWNYKTQDPSIRHMGPMAQDFYTLFGLGENETSISTVDIDGINMAAIQSLEKITRELKQKYEQIEVLKKRLEEIKKEKDFLEKRISTAEELIEKNNLLWKQE